MPLRDPERPIPLNYKEHALHHNLIIRPRELKVCSLTKGYWALWGIQNNPKARPEGGRVGIQLRETHSEGEKDEE